MRTEGEIMTAAFLEAIAQNLKSPLVGAKFAVEVLEDLLTRIEQEIANEHRCPECGRGGQWVLMPHVPCDEGESA